MALLPSAVALLLLAASASTEAGPIRRNARPVPGAYVVVLRDDSVRAARERDGSRPSVADLWEEMVERRHLGRLLHRYEHGLRGFALATTDAEAAELAADPRVAWVEEDGEVVASDATAAAGWGLDRIDQRDLPLSGTYASDAHRRRRPRLRDRHGPARDARRLPRPRRRGLLGRRRRPGQRRLQRPRHARRGDARGQPLRRRAGGEAPPGSRARLQRPRRHRRGDRRRRVGDRPPRCAGGGELQPRQRGLARARPRRRARDPGRRRVRGRRRQRERRRLRHVACTRRARSHGRGDEQQ